MFLLAVGLVTAGVVALSTSTPLEDRLEDRLDDILQLDGIELNQAERDLRMTFFTLSCLAQSSTSALNSTTGQLCPDITADALYSPEELEHMNGAVMEEVADEEEEEWFAEPERTRRQVVETPSSFDIRDEIWVSQPQHQGVCGNCYVHALTSALDIAYTRATGEHAHFSRQELTDCFFKGCNGGDYRFLAKMINTVDHLASADDYGPYLSMHSEQHFACKAAVTPDSLLAIKVKGYKPVTVDTVEEDIIKYGSVITCLLWGSEGEECGGISQAAGRKEIYDGPEIPGGCSHAVLIVGYGPDYYLVRNSHGVSWGDGGYFKIRRGGNVCGIEDRMVALVTAERGEPKQLAVNNCPIDKPHFCTQSMSCTSSPTCRNPYRLHDRTKRHLSTMDLQTRIDLYQQQLVDQQRRRARKYKNRFSTRNNVATCEDSYGAMMCGKLKVRGQCSATRIRDKKCRRTCGTCTPDTTREEPSRSPFEEGAPDGCEDISPICNQISDHVCSSVYRIRQNCKRHCGACSSRPNSVDILSLALLWNPSQPEGPCDIPVIPHGRVLTTSSQMYSGEDLRVECDPGYTLVGEDVTCVIQEVFSHDQRYIPQCIKLEDDGEIVGNGASYRGTRSTSALGKPCLNWSAEVSSGSILTVDGIGNVQHYLTENHNFCRNYNGTRTVPFCLVQHSYNYVITELCFEAPGCDVCEGAVDHPSVAETHCVRLRDCNYGSSSREMKNEYLWKYCTKTCCRLSTCNRR